MINDLHFSKYPKEEPLKTRSQSRKNTGAGNQSVRRSLVPQVYERLYKGAIEM